MDSPLLPILGMMGGSLAGGASPSLPMMADQLDMLAGTTGYQSLHTLARGFREMHDEIENDNGMDLT